MKIVISREKLEEIKNKLQKYEKTWSVDDKAFLPPHFAPWVPQKKDDKPFYWYPPEHSIVLQLKCNELIRTVGMSSGITCRFPRVVKYRDDKAYTDIMTLEELKAVVDNPKKSVTCAEAGQPLDDYEEPGTGSILQKPKRKRKEPPEGRGPGTVPKHMSVSKSVFRP